MDGTVLAFDLESQLLATEVEKIYASDLQGASPWTRPDLFGFSCGVTIDVETGVVSAYMPGRAGTMIEHLQAADMTVSYNGSAFDLGVLSTYGDVADIRQKHVDLNVLVMQALDKLDIDRQGTGRIRQGGLDGLARANGLAGKTGQAVDVPTLLREGRVDEVQAYCAEDARIVAELYRLARRDGKLAVDAYLKKGKERIELGRLEVAIEIPDGDLPSGTCERCDDGMPADELVRVGGETVCQPCAEEEEDRRAEECS